ncbi:uncharacterized protein LOC116572479 isoform X1 [Mustela erminea]|uniref:uncharacterized protein LOC116572479 isoform X1 n=1 Tax=Mustela erminea TaxID=36723 RepID=UPI001386C0CD|nr:uncharacterized protein LOC116572479 isoform X1 [Mustela erminea]
MLRQSTAAALQMSVPAPSKELERQQAGGFRAVPFSPTFSPSPPRNLATASSPPTTSILRPPPPPAKELRKRHCLLAALLSSAALWLRSEYHRGTLKPAAQLEQVLLSHPCTEVTALAVSSVRIKFPLVPSVYEVISTIESDMSLPLGLRDFFLMFVTLCVFFKICPSQSAGFPGLNGLFTGGEDSGPKVRVTKLYKVSCLGSWSTNPSG